MPYRSDRCLRGAMEVPIGALEEAARARVRRTKQRANMGIGSGLGEGVPLSVPTSDFDCCHGV